MIPGTKPAPRIQLPSYIPGDTKTFWEFGPPSSQDRSPLNDFEGYSHRQIITPSLEAVGRQFRFTFLQSQDVRYCSFEFQDTIYRTLFAPKEITFNNGQHGFSGGSFPNTIVSDWIDLGREIVSDSGPMVVIMDIGNTEHYYYEYLDGCVTYYRSSMTSYNQASPSSGWTVSPSGVVGLINKIEVR